MSIMAGVVPCQSPELLWVCHWHGTYSTAFPVGLAGEWLRGRTAKTQTGTHIRYGHCRQWLNALSHNSGPNKHLYFHFSANFWKSPTVGVPKL